MSGVSRRRKRTGVRGRSVTRPHVEGLEARLAAGTVLDLFGSHWAGPRVSGPPNGVLPSEVVTADSAAGQRRALAHQSRSPVIPLLFAPTALKNSEGSRSSGTSLSPNSSRESAIVLDPRWTGNQDPSEAAWDRMGMFDNLQRGAIPNGPLAPPRVPRRVERQETDSETAAAAA